MSLLTKEECLGILGFNSHDKEVNIDEINRAYKKKARQLHPDKNDSTPDSLDKFQQLQKAYAQLKDNEFEDESSAGICDASLANMAMKKKMERKKAENLAKGIGKEFGESVPREEVYQNAAFKTENKSDAGQDSYNPTLPNGDRPTKNIDSESQPVRNPRADGDPGNSRSRTRDDRSFDRKNRRDSKRREKLQAEKKSSSTSTSSGGEKTSALTFPATNCDTETQTENGKFSSNVWTQNRKFETPEDRELQEAIELSKQSYLLENTLRRDDSAVSASGWAEQVEQEEALASSVPQEETSALEKKSTQRNVILPDAHPPASSWRGPMRDDRPPRFANRGGTQEGGRFAGRAARRGDQRPFSNGPRNYSQQSTRGGEGSYEYREQSEGDKRGYKRTDNYDRRPSYEQERRGRTDSESSVASKLSQRGGESDQRKGYSRGGFDRRSQPFVNMPRGYGRGQPISALGAIIPPPPRSPPKEITGPVDWDEEVAAYQIRQKQQADNLAVKIQPPPLFEDAACDTNYGAEEEESVDNAITADPEPVLPEPEVVNPKPELPPVSSSTDVATSPRLETKEQRIRALTKELFPLLDSSEHLLFLYRDYQAESDNTGESKIRPPPGLGDQSTKKEEPTPPSNGFVPPPAPFQGFQTMFPYGFQWFPMAQPVPPGATGAYPTSNSPDELRMHQQMLYAAAQSQRMAAGYPMIPGHPAPFSPYMVVPNPLSTMNGTLQESAANNWGPEPEQPNREQR